MRNGRDSKRSKGGKQKMKKILLLAVLCAGLTGCATVGGVSDEKLAERAAFALNLKPGSFTITNRIDEGGDTYFTVKTKSGKTHNCTLSSYSHMRSTRVSDAICGSSNPFKR